MSMLYVRRALCCSLLFALGIALPSWTALAQGTTGKIAGVVTEASTGDPLPGANVVVRARIENGRSIPMSDLRGGVTDVDGNYFIINLRPGQYAVEASFLGYSSVVTQPVGVQVGRTTTVDFELGEATFEGEEIVVTAERELIQVDRTSSSASLSGEDLQALPVENLADALELQAGITTGLDGSIHIRGGRSSEIQYYVDGIAVANPFNNALAVPVENNAIEQLEVISGAFNAEYGQAMSGIINIVTKEGADELTGTFQAQFGSHLTGNDDIFLGLDSFQPTSQQFYEGSLSGPLFTNRLKFFVSGKITDADGWLYGQRTFLPQDSASFASPNPDEWLIQRSGDGALVPMNTQTAYSGQAKLTARITNTVKLSYNLLAFSQESQLYDHGRRLNPDGRPQRFYDSYNHHLKLEQTIGQRSFYNLSVAYYLTRQQSYVYEDPFDSRYRFLFGRGQQPQFLFSTGGLDGSHSDRRSNVLAIRGDFTSQVTNAHLIKLGAEVRMNKLEDEFFVIDVDPNRYGSFDSNIPPVTSISHNILDADPIEISAYIQDKIEINDLIVNMGVRFDYFDARSVVPEDLRDPSDRIFPEDSPEQAFIEVDPITQVSPRIGLAFPITERGVFRASFGQFFQIPEYQRLYENPEFEVLGEFGFIGNAALDAQRTDMYEIGLQQELFGVMALDFSLFYRDIRSLLGTELNETYRGELYGRYANEDFGSVRGFTAAIDARVPGTGFSAGLDYTYQSAKGVASDPKQAFFDRQNANNVAAALLPLDWDLRHSINLFLNYGGNAWGGSVIGRVNSGYPFTPDELRFGTPLVDLRNGARYQGDFVVDLRAYKRFSVGQFRPEFYVMVENLFDRIRDQFLPRLDPREVEAHTANGLDIINTREAFALNPGSQPEPRHVKLGFRLQF